MTRDEVADVIAMVRLGWPHSTLGDDPNAVLGMWFSVLRAAGRQEAEAAVYELLATGREQAPPVGAVVQTIARRRAESPEWDEAWNEISRLIGKFGVWRKPPAEAFSHVLVAHFALPAWNELCLAPAPGTNGHGTHKAQQREAYKAMRARVERDASLGVIGAPRRRAELHKFDLAGLLAEGVPDDAA